MTCYTQSCFGFFFSVNGYTVNYHEKLKKLSIVLVHDTYKFKAKKLFKNLEFYSSRIILL